LIQRGEIRWFRFNRPDKRRPVLVLGKENLLSSLSQIPVIPLSTQARGLPWEVELRPAEGVPGLCFLKPEWICAVDRTALGPWIADLPAARWGEVRGALLEFLGFEA
jgi:mRNA interferase MazF